MSLPPPSTGIATSVAGIPDNGLTPTPPQTRLAFLSSADRDIAHLRPITIPEGTRINVAFNGGTWTKPDGTLLANIVPNVGGEQGYQDHTGILNMNIKYTVQFVEDNKWGYVQGKGVADGDGVTKLFITLESDSVAAKGLTGQTIYAPGHFQNELIVATNWVFVVST
ncbi:hypothetical protein BS47DRAFT_1393863 [Hydnum rufescens UP504]|uniref:Uncharacterized protein n=1 Tax=Hydnum rufescens UP504 TaxID=1448309 RepID=A0A9P6AVP9_9AGAM|nr:hypothetical protein BS47DRAFT_1393863 [Hydnum rufescens UP504]